jgi:hypothetical protein
VETTSIASLVLWRRVCQAVAATFTLAGANFVSTLCVQCSMDYLEERDADKIERLGKQSGFLLSTYRAELARDPTSCGTESSRSNMIALWHTIRQIYGKAVLRAVANLVYANTKRHSTTHVTSSNP